MYMTSIVVKAANKLAELDEEKLASLEANATLDWQDLCEAQTAQSLAFAGGLIPQEVAQWMYRVAGGEVPSAERFAKRPLAERMVFIETLYALLGALAKAYSRG